MKNSVVPAMKEHFVCELIKGSSVTRINKKVTAPNKKMLLPKHVKQLNITLQLKLSRNS